MRSKDQGSDLGRAKYTPHNAHIAPELIPDPKSYWFDPDVIFGSGIRNARGSWETNRLLLLVKASSFKLQA